MEWKQSGWGRFFTGSLPGHITLEGNIYTLTLGEKAYSTSLDDKAHFHVQRGIFWASVRLERPDGQQTTIDGIPNKIATSLRQSLSESMDAIVLRQNIFTISEWLLQLVSTTNRAEKERRWITHETQTDLLNKRPTIDAHATWTLLLSPHVRDKAGIKLTAGEAALTQWEADHVERFRKFNEDHTARELITCKSLLENVESKPLTLEQSRAVICFDNRVQVVASAGSGKTSTMVAKAAYAVHRELVAPERIIMLAFNKQAAEELKERARLAFQRLSMESVTVEASTFHSLGLGIIGKATGKKPDVPDWAVDTTLGFRKLSHIIEKLRHDSPTFNLQWNLFRFVFGSPSTALDTFASSGTEESFTTIKGEKVKSLQELMIANWLFLNGVTYEYERPYEHVTADESHRQYKPDFYYPEINLYHEHFALDGNGHPPAHFKDYLQGVIWKRQLHSTHKTVFFETTSHQFTLETIFDVLTEELQSRGITLDPNPDRATPNVGIPPISHQELVGLIRTFISHAKSNSLTPEALTQRIAELPKFLLKLRFEIFLKLFIPILKAWDAALSAEHSVDFEDMLNKAADLLESGKYDTPYDLVMADEFQDASRSRARLCRAMVQKPGRHLFAVGDDWQSINRFAGADVSVMTGFTEWVGHGQVLKLEQTFRCPQTLCNISSQFVSKNPAQIPKAVHSVTEEKEPVIHAIQAKKREDIHQQIDRILSKLCSDLRQGVIAPSRNGKVSVYILGRYNADRSYFPPPNAHYAQWLDLSFQTIHRSKGSEADYVIMPTMLSRIKGLSFPNTRADDPLLSLAMPDSDTFPNGEERRLFYVALTRARRSVFLLTAMGERSSFLTELMADGVVTLVGSDGKEIKEEICPACKKGMLVKRTGPYSEFIACSTYPYCNYVRRLNENTNPNTGQAPQSSQKHRHDENSRTKANPFDSAEWISPPKKVRENPTLKESNNNNSSKIGFFESLNNGITSLTNQVATQLAVQRATRDLSIQVHREQTVINGLIKGAESLVEIEKFRAQSPEHAATYDESYAYLTGKLNSDSRVEDSEYDDIFQFSLPDFHIQMDTADEEARQAIQQEVLNLKNARNTYFSKTSKLLRGNSILKSAFIREAKRRKTTIDWPLLGISPSDE